MFKISAFFTIAMHSSGYWMCEGSGIFTIAMFVMVVCEGWYFKIVMFAWLCVRVGILQ